MFGCLVSLSPFGRTKLLSLQASKLPTEGPSGLLRLGLAVEALGLRHAQAAGGQRLGVERLGGGEAFGPRRGRPCESPGEKLLDQIGGGRVVFYA